MKIVISSGHGLYVRGASGIIDEVDEARKVVDRTADLLRTLDIGMITFHDNTSKSQSENLDTIINFHNSQDRDLDVSVHFNAYIPTDGERGVEVLYVTQEELALAVATEIHLAGGLILRGAHYRSDLAFLNGTDEPAILIEVCFVDAMGDTDKYLEHFEQICWGIARSISGAPSQRLVNFKGTCSWFGGPDDMGVSPDENLAFLFSVNDAPTLFLAEQPPGTTGLARRLDPETFYVACRWDYDVTSKEMLANQDLFAVVKANGLLFLARPSDWGPHEEKTGRAADLSPGLMDALGINTDDYVEVYYPVQRGLRYAALPKTS